MVEEKMTKFCLHGPESQKAARKRLENAYAAGRFPQALLIEGNRGIGKKALAIEVARMLSCTNSEQVPCGICSGCSLASNPGNTHGWIIPLETAEANAKSATDVSENSKAKTVEDIKAGYIAKIFENPYSVSYVSGIAQIAVEQIRGMTSQFSLTSENSRVVIVAEADRMNESAANALLKTLEEVPPNTYFILTSSAPGRLLQTIRSRCNSLSLPSLSLAETEEISRTVTGESLSPDALGMALGSPGMAMYYNSDIAENETRAFQFLKDSAEGNYSDLFFDLDKYFARDASAVDSAIVMLDFVEFLVGDALRLLVGEACRLPDQRQNLETLDLGRFGSVALEKAILEIVSASEKIANRKNSVIVALQTLSIGLFEGYKK